MPGIGACESREVVLRSTMGHVDGKAVDVVRLTSDAGVEIDIVGLGAAVVGWRVPVRGGHRPVVLGSAALDACLQRTEYLGCVVGRVANRIPGARFQLGEQWHAVDANEGSTCLHGGRQGLSRQVWELELDQAACAVRATHTSPHGAMGFPGRVAVQVTWRLDGHTLHFSVDAQPDRPTPISMTQHLYFNLDGGGTIRGHQLRVDADRTLALDAHQCATGAWDAVAGTGRDLRIQRPVAPSDEPPGLDHYFGFRADRDPERAPVVMASTDGSLDLSLWTDRPGVQIYDGAGLAAGVRGWPDVGPWSGICLEDQDPPGATAHPHLGRIVCSPDRPYRHRSRIRIAPG